MSEQPRRPFELALTADELGTALGTVAWVLGALEIMKDRGHAQEDETYHDLLERLSPQVERLLERLGASQSAVNDERQHTAVERSYSAIREAFEAWVELTAVDTVQVAIGQRLAAAVEGGVIELPEDFPLPPGLQRPDREPPSS